MMSKKSPQLRFEGFTDDWEERKLGDLTTISTGKLDANAMVENGKYDFYTSGIKKYRIDVAAFEGPSITIAGNGATVGYMHLADNKFNAYQRTYVLQEFLVDRSFIFSEIGNKLPKKIKQEARTGNIPYIVMDMLTELKLSIPQNNSEQQKIGSFFKQLDDTIDLHQRKLDLLKEQKKGYLQKMFPKNGAKVPELRFAGFADDWEERKLKELFQPSKNKNNNGLYNQKDILAASLGTELIPKRTFFGLKSTKESVKNYRIVKTGDLIYTKSSIKGFPNGIIRSNKGNVGIVPPLYCVYTLQKDINSSIIQLYFEDKNRLDFYLFPLVNVGARNNVNITDLEFLEGKVTIPKSYEEQSKIVQFMEQLNRTIDLHQRKLDLLKEQKKGFLQKMFV
ncbi:restriction endonuclease subunit S [Lactococcus cremoris]|nr:restriction endonuclease subunit S [Lactococcus cremoris]MCT4430651.1 restriction endonuclease subunit S [Lactococcus cremoris]